ncbi:MAG TPA: gluconokinase, partial [Bacteroidetes bacterium]|nr:gluconokinase [Bacteroidota bacterium]
MLPKSSAETPREGRSVRVLIVAGPAGSGKTTVGRAAAARLGWAFVDADDYHAADSLRKMARGEGLTDADRAPWLARLAALVGERVRAGPPTV